MDPLRLPIKEVIVSFELPPEHLVLMARYLTAANGKARRQQTFIPKPNKWGRAVVTRRLQGVAERPEETLHEMAEQLEVWLRFARRGATAHEPSAADVAEWYLSGSIRGFTGTLPDLTDQEALEFKQAARAVVGHECGKTPGCAVCLAGRRGQWNDVFAITETDPELLVELHRNFRAAGYPGIPARTNPAKPYEHDF